MLKIIDTLDIKAESVPLSMAERDALRAENDRLFCLSRDEETKWAQ